MPCSKILSWRHKRCILRPFIRPLYPTYFWNFKKCLNYQNCFGCWTFLKSISQKMVHTSKISISPIHQNFHMVHNSQNFHVTHSPKFSYLWDGSQLHPAFLAGQPWPRPPPVHLHRPWLRPSRDLQTGRLSFFYREQKCPAIDKTGNTCSQVRGADMDALGITWWVKLYMCKCS